MKERVIVVYHETALQSIVSDIFTVGSLVAAVAVGKWIDSSALQWIAGILTIIAVVTFKPKQGVTFTDVEKAKAFLDTVAKR